MSDESLLVTPYMAHRYCPGCEPEPEGLLEVVWCSAHEPDRGGDMDKVVDTRAYLGGSQEAGGDDNRVWCNALHRGVMVLALGLLLAGCGGLQTYDVDCKGRVNVVVGPYGGMSDCGDGAYLHVRPSRKAK